jgi:hypothetical protein
MRCHTQVIFLRRFFWFAALALSAAVTPAQTLQVFHGHVPPAIGRLNLQPTGRLPGSQRLNLVIGLPLRNQPALDDFLAQVYDPASTNYHHYLTPEQFTKQFGPTEQDYQAAIAFMRTNGLTVTGKHPNRVIFDVSGSVADVERVFHVTMRVYRHSKEARTFYAPDTEPSVNLAVPIRHISGLDNYSLPHPMNLKRETIPQSLNAMAQTGSGPGGTYGSADLRAAYVPGVSLDGSGQTVGLLEFDGYYTNDITAYESGNGLPNVALINVLIDTLSEAPGADNGEVALDIEMAIAMAPGLSSVIVYEAPNADPTGPLHILNRMASDNVAKQISSSWAIGDDPNYDVDYKQFAAQGQSFFQASGDDGAYSVGIAQWADDTNVTLVGGTTLSTTAPGGVWSSETAWNWNITAPPYTNSTGGGINFNGIPIPSWQTGINMTTNQGSTTLRNSPDVALTADNIWVIYDNGSNALFGGTSCAAPLWAGFTALINQQAAALGKSPVGFINPAVYAIGKSVDYVTDFHDITTGNNTNGSSGNEFFAVPGYDLCTGWGTPNGVNLINTLAPPDPLQITPLAPFTASGPAGGPFTPTGQVFSLTNAGTTPLNWSLVNTSAWLTASLAGGTLTSGGPAATMTVSLNSLAGSLPGGVYTASVLFTNLNTGFGQSRQFTLLSGELVQNGGFETGDFSDWMVVGSGSSYDYVDNGSASGITPHSGAYLAIFGEIGQLAYFSQVLPTRAGQSYLLSFWLYSLTYNGQTTPNDFLAQWNGNTLINSTNMGAFGWTNLQFMVTATGPSTVLQFGGQDDPAWLGLDDVSVQPISSILFQTKRTNNSFQFSWNTLTGLVYQVQYKTNLLQTNWINLGGSLPTTNTLMTTSDIITNSQRYYRIQLTQ